MKLTFFYFILLGLLPFDIVSQEYIQLLNQGAKEYENEQYDKAISTLLKAKQSVEDHLGSNNDYFFYIINILAQSYYESEHYQEAEKVILEAYNTLKANPYLDKSKALSVFTYNNLVKIFYFQDKYEDAVKYGEEGIIQLSGVEHEKIPELNFTLGAAYKELYKYDLALKQFEKVLNSVSKQDKFYFKAKEAVAVVQFKQGKYLNAEKQLEEVLKLTEQSIGKNNTTYANILLNLGQAKHKLQKFFEAEKILLQAISIWETFQKSSSKDYALTIGYYADLLIDIGEYNKAIQQLEKALTIYQRNNDHINIALTYNQLASCYGAKGNIASAETFYYKGLQIAKQFQGKDYSIYGTIFLNLAGLYAENLIFSKADSAFQTALKVHDKVYSQNSLEYQEALMNYSAFKMMIADYSFAEKNLPKILNFFEKKLGKLSMQYISCLGNLALLYTEKEDFKTADNYYMETLSLTEKMVGKKNHHYINIMNNYAVFLARLGNYEEAATWTDNAFSLSKTFLEQNSISYANLLNNYATFYLMNYKTEQATQYFKICQDILKNYEPEHPLNIIVNSQLASTFIVKANYKDASTILEKWLPIAEKVFGKEHPHYLTIINNLCIVYVELNKYTQAETMLLNSRTIIEKIYGKKHNLYMIISSNLAYVYTKLGKYAQSHKIYQEIINTFFQQIPVVFPILSEKEKIAFMEQQRRFLLQFMQLVKNYYNSNPTIIEELLEYRMMLRGLVTEATCNFKNLVANSKNSEIQNLYSQWLNYKTQYLKVLSMKESEKNFQDLNGLYNQLNQTEKLLQEKLGISYPKPERVSWKSVQQNLKPNEVAIEIILQVSIKDTNYFFLIITPNSTQPELLIVSAGNLEDYVYSYYFKNVVDRKYVDKKSYAVLWQNIISKSKVLKNYTINKLYLVCDGIYHKIPIGTLLIPEENKFLIQKMEIVYLLNLKHIRNTSNNVKTAVIVGYPNYKGNDLLPNKLPEEQFTIPEEQRNLVYKVFGFNNSIPMLPGTKKETDLIHDLLKNKQIQSTLMQGADATEEKLKTMQSPSILHIATHGYFIQDEDILNSDYLEYNTFEILLQNPLLRSGILLANCENDLLKKSKIVNNYDDGILTAYESSYLNLQNTELVVLSACQTGLGAIKNEEGVFGLQRSFFIAGAKSLILSLWSVDDRATQEFMTNFYDAWLNKKMTKTKAFYFAQDTIRSNEEFASPYYWGAFILIGE